MVRFFHKDLSFILFFVLSAFYQCSVIRRLIATFYLFGAIQTSKTYFINQIYQIMVISMLKDQSCRYYSYYFIKLVRFISIYYAINLDIVSSIWF